ncbi:hypothetical protein HK104_001166 [Borealophlyctis nickersoniae]|nr:hypothetical protein HK104_001166 [Borealophlyctis nickersoniae]
MGPLLNCHGTPLPTNSSITSSAIAVTGVEEKDLPLEENLDAISKISRELRNSGKGQTVPLTADLQSGYGDRLEEGVRKVIELGVVGIDLEDSVGLRRMQGVDEQVDRIKRVTEVAKKHGVDGFVVTVKTKTMLFRKPIEETIFRGRRGPRCAPTGMGTGMDNDEVKRFVDAFDGRLSVKLMPGAEKSAVDEFRRMGVARITMEDGLRRETMPTIAWRLDELLGKIEYS